MQNKFIFGITGPTGSGKTMVSDILRELGAQVIDCDIISREVSMAGEPCLLELCEAFGDGILDLDGNLDRRAMGDIVFSDEKLLKVLSDITHKHIKLRTDKIIEKSYADIIGIDGAVIFGSPVETMCEVMVSVVADVEIRADRIKKRDAIDDQKAMMRIKSQKSNEFYIEKSDYIVYNNLGLDELKEQVREVWNQLQQKREEKNQKLR